MTSSPLFLIAGIACIAVLVILLFGVGSFAKGGEFNKRNANKLMQARIVAQAVAVVLILLLVAFGRNGG